MVRVQGTACALPAIRAGTVSCTKVSHRRTCRIPELPNNLPSDYSLVLQERDEECLPACPVLANEVDQQREQTQNEHSEDASEDYVPRIANHAPAL